MNGRRKLQVHALVMLSLIIFTYVAWNASEKEILEREMAADDIAMNGEWDPYAEVRLAEADDGGVAVMLKVGVPLFITMIYGGILSVVYLLPMFVDKLGDEVMGSSAEVEVDPLQEARAAVAAGNYPEAVGLYHKYWLERRDERFPVVEISKIQRTHLKSPALALHSLEEALDDHEWPVDDAAFLLFRIAELYEEDLSDRENLTATLRRVSEKFQGTRHSVHAEHKLRELEKG